MNVNAINTRALQSARTRFFNRHNSQRGDAPLLPDRMWVRELSHAQPPCSKTVLFISSVTLLCNAVVCMCTVRWGAGTGGGGG